MNSKCFLSAAILIGICSNYLSCSQAVGQNEIQKFVSLVTKNGTLQPVVGLVEFLNDRIKNAGDGGEREPELSRMLNSGWVFPFIMNQRETSAGARAVYFFVRQVEENTGLQIMAHLGCVIGGDNLSEKLALLEKIVPNINDVEVVDELEFRARLDSLRQESLGDMKLEASKKLATTLLKEFQQAPADAPWRSWVES